MKNALLLTFIFTGPFCARAADNPPPSLPPLPPTELSADFGVSTPEAEGVDTAKLIELTHSIRDQKLPIFSFLISRHGKLIYEAYTSSLGRDEAHYLMSITKSVTSTLVGIAISQNKIPGVDVALTKILPARVFGTPANAKRFTALTLKDVLNMSALDALQPPHSNTPEAVERAKQTGAAKNHVEFALTQKLLPAPGETFQYNDLTPYLATGAIEYSAKKTELDYAQEVLFGPLGFRNVEWMHEDAAGIDNGAYGLRLRPLDMQKFGILFLHGGKWNGKQLVPKAWVDQSFQPGMRSDASVRNPNYGWYWWHENFIAAWESHEARGWKGQYIAVIPSVDLVVTMTADIEDDTELAVLRNLVRNFVVPAVRGEKAATQDPKLAAELTQALAELRATKLIPAKAEKRMIPSIKPKEQHHDFHP